MIERQKTDLRKKKQGAENNVTIEPQAPKMFQPHFKSFIAGA